jgi:hypothetical protein
MYKAKIRHLEEMHRVLNKKIDDHERNHPHTNVTQLMDMKKEKLKIRDEISNLNRLQWEHDHETIHDDE